MKPQFLQHRLFIPRKNEFRNTQKLWWTRGYTTWNPGRFKSRLRATRETFEVIVNMISHSIVKMPTNAAPNPIEPHQQIALTLYRLGHSCSFPVISDLFGVSRSLAIATLNLVCRHMVKQTYDQYAVCRRGKWKAEGFIKNRAPVHERDFMYIGAQN